MLMCSVIPSCSNIVKIPLTSWLGILIFGSDSWDLHQMRRNFKSVSIWRFRLENLFRIPQLKIHQIRISIPKFRIPKKFNIGIQYISFRTRKQSQYLFPPKLHLLALLVKRVDVMLVGLNTSRCDVGRQNNHAAILRSTQNEMPPS
jgi:hypothetical protein